MQLDLTSQDSLFASSPSNDNFELWYVWDVYQGLPPKPIFFGSMEDCGLVADAKNIKASKKKELVNAA